jgi:hypothetical protein
MKAFFNKWWGKFKSSPTYVKAGIVALIFFGIYMIFIRKSGEYDNVTSAEVSNPSTDTEEEYTYTPTPISSGTGSDEAYDNMQKAYEAQLTALNLQNQKLASEMGNQTPGLSDYLNPVIANVAGNWLTNLINPGKNTITTKTSNTSSPIETTNNSNYVFSTQKSNTSNGNSLKNSSGNYFDFDSPTSNNTSIWSATNNFTSGTYTGFGSDAYAKENYGW